jgi:myo-inositol-1(or 4)-monophosphatase
VPSEEQVLAAQSLVVDTFKSFREELLTVFGNSEFTRKGDFSPVTTWDVAVETKLSEALKVSFPTFGFQGEETGKSGNDQTYWLVDPIDGTTSFIRGLPYSTNMAALVHDNEVIAAVIYDFVHDIVYTAIKDKGAYKDGVRIRTNTKRRTNDLLIYVMTRKQFPLIREALQELGMRTVQPMGAAGHAYSLLAEGKIDGIVNLHTSMGAYDNAPGLLLAEEAGASVLAYDSETGVNRHEFIVGSPFVVDEIEKSGLL